MRERHWWLAGWTPVVLTVLVAFWTSWSTGASISRLGDPPASNVTVADRHVAGLIIVTVIGAGVAAFVTARARHRGAGELLAMTARPPFVVSSSLLFAVAGPMAAGWVFSIAATFIRFSVRSEWTQASLIMVVSLSAVPVGVSLGFVVGTLLPRVLAPVLAVILAYVLLLVSSVFGDDKWWAGLGPGLGPYLGGIRPVRAVIWAFLEMAWFAGLTVALGAIGTSLCVRPRLVPGKIGWAAVGVGLSAACALASLNVT